MMEPNQFHSTKGVGSFHAWTTPSNKTYHWVDDDKTTVAVCGATNRGWRKVLDLRGDDLNATVKARECQRCDQIWKEG